MEFFSRREVRRWEYITSMTVPCKSTLLIFKKKLCISIKNFVLDDWPSKYGYGSNILTKLNNNNIVSYLLHRLAEKGSLKYIGIFSYASLHFKNAFLTFNKRLHLPTGGLAEGLGIWHKLLLSYNPVISPHSLNECIPLIRKVQVLVSKIKRHCGCC